VYPIIVFKGDHLHFIVSLLFVKTIGLNHTPPLCAQLFKYAAATLLQFGFMAGFLFAADNFAATLNSAIPYLKLKERWSPWAVGLLFAFLSNNSRIFSFFDHRRPPAAAAVVSVPTEQPAATNAPAGKQPLVKRLRWPPWLKRNSKRIRLVPFVWLAMTALRGWSSALVYGACGTLCAAPLLVLVAHLSVGDTWNHITNIERRIGVSASSCVWLLASVGLAVWSFYLASPRAGYLLAPSAVWISVACLLSWDIWRLNAPRQRLVPTVADGKATGWGLEYSLFGALWRLVTTGTRRHPVRKPVSGGQFEAVDAK
jgi:tryptophan-rich sensory protein